MAENTNIEWATHTWNPWRGCTKVSAGCANCYADTMSKRNPLTLGVWGPNGTRVVAAESAWKLPLKWNKAAALAEDLWRSIGGDTSKPGTIDFEGTPATWHRPRVFPSLCDPFEDWQGPMVDSRGRRLVCPPQGKYYDAAFDPTLPDCATSDVRRRLFELIDNTPALDWLLLTKRPENIGKMLPEWSHTAHDVMGRKGLTLTTSGHYPPRENLWLGVSVENQATADERIPHLLSVPAAVRFLSVEPLLGPVDLSAWLLLGIDWVIIGGESGPGARPMHPNWARSLRDQCQAAGVPFFFKQWGEFQPYTDENRFTHGDTETDRNSHVWMHRDGTSGLCWISDEDHHWQNWTGEPKFDPETGMLADEYAVLAKVGKKAAGRLLDGREWNESPAVKAPSTKGAP